MLFHLRHIIVYCTDYTMTESNKILHAFISPGDSTPQSNSYTATYHSSRKLLKLDEPNPQDTAGEVGTSLWVMYSCGPFHIDEQRQDVQFEPIYSSCRAIRDVSLRIGREQLSIGRCGARWSGISVLIEWHDDDDDDGSRYFHILITEFEWFGKFGFLIFKDVIISIGYLMPSNSFRTVVVHLVLR